MNLRQFEALRLVLARGTTKHAAEALGVTQSAVSRQIMALEASLGFSLFERRNGRLVVTPEGQHFYKAVENVLLEMDQIRAMARDTSTMRIGSLRLAAMPALAFGLLPAAIKRIRTRYRRIKISVDVAVRHVVEEGIAGGKYDLGLVTLPIENDTLNVEPICRMECVCVLPTGHRLGDRPVIEARELEDEEFISLEPETMMRYRTDELFGRLGVRRSLCLETHSTVMICSLVASGVGVSLVHKFIADAFSDRLVVKPFLPALQFEYGLLLPAGPALSPIAREFLATLRRSIAEAGAVMLPPRASSQPLLASASDR
ncbi:MAG: LysR family transcriptional regulator [Geminicoccaceae bacterium]